MGECACVSEQGSTLNSIKLDPGVCEVKVQGVAWPVASWLLTMLAH